MNNHLIFRAVEMAAIAHRNQKRKGSDIPYIVHPAGVGLFLMRYGCKDEVIIAGLLHDVLEDTSEYTMDKLRIEFGENVVALLDKTYEHDKTESWETRKKHTLAQLPLQSTEVLLVSLADKYHNLYSIYIDLQNAGDQLWNRFKRGRKDQEWYYRGIAEAVKPLENTSYKPMLDEYRALLVRVFGDK